MENNHKASTGATEIILDLRASGTAVYDLVKGADGAWSRVQQMVSKSSPFFSDSLFVTATVRNVSTNYSHLLKADGSRTLRACGNCNAIVGQRGPQDSIRDLKSPKNVILW